LYPEDCTPVIAHLSLTPSYRQCVRNGIPIEPLRETCYNTCYQDSMQTRVPVRPRKGCNRRTGGVHSLREHDMFERLADFWDIVIFGFVLIMLASFQLRHASSAEIILALAAIVFGVGLLLAKKWAL